jgi:hypothetical protein
VNGQIRNVYHRVMNSVIGTRGERILKVVVGEDGALVTAYPMRSSAFLRAAGGAAIGAALMALDHVMDPPRLNAGEANRRPSVRDDDYNPGMLPVMIPVPRPKP